MSFGQVAPVDSKQVAIIKALIAAHDLLLGDLQEISKSINTAIDLSDLTSKLDAIKLNLVDGVSVQHSSKPQNGIQVFYLTWANGTFFDILLYFDLKDFFCVELWIGTAYCSCYFPCEVKLSYNL